MPGVVSVGQAKHSFTSSFVDEDKIDIDGAVINTRQVVVKSKTHRAVLF